MTVDASVLVPVLDEARHIRATAAAMAAQRFDGTLEFLLLDGGSRDGTRELLDEIAAADPRFRVIDNPARTIPAALNLGLRHARGTYVARMDAHATYPPDYVAAGVARLQQGGADWVTGPAVPEGDGRWSGRVARALVLPLGQGGSRKWRAAADADGEEWELDSGVFAGVWRRSVLEELGGWDDTFAVNEDAEMAARALARGARIVCLPSMAATYAPRDTLPALFRQYWRFGFYRVRTTRRHPDALRPSHVASAALGLAVATVAVPRLRPLSASLCAAYAVALTGATARGASDLPLRERAGVAAALSTMHVAWGTGFVAACLRHGPPLRAIGRTLRRALSTTQATP